MQPLGYRPDFTIQGINPYEQRFFPFLPFLGGLAGGIAGGLLVGGLFTRPPYGYGYYPPPPFYGQCFPPYCNTPFY